MLTFTRNPARSTLSAVLSLSLILTTANAKYVCDTSLGSYYPYCVNIPDGATEKMPAILFLSGSGARGDAKDAKSLSTYDGIGKLVSQYNSGNRGDAQTIAATKFTSIIPVSPKYLPGGGEVRHWSPEYLNNVLDKVIAAYPVDTDRISVGGYSMGSRGCWRYGVDSASRIAALFPSAGGAEAKGDSTLSQQKADPTFDKLAAIAKVNLPVWQFAGSYDTTAGTDSPKKTQNELVKDGETASKLSIISSDHSGMSTKPFTAELLNWVLQQKRSSASSSSPSSVKTDESDDSENDGGEEYVAAPASSTRAQSAAAATQSSTTSSCSSKRRVRRSDMAEPTIVVQRGLTLSNILARRAAHQAEAAMLAHRAEAEQRRAEASREQGVSSRRGMLVDNTPKFFPPAEPAEVSNGKSSASYKFKQHRARGHNLGAGLPGIKKRRA